MTAALECAQGVTLTVATALESPQGLLFIVTAALEGTQAVTLSVTAESEGPQGFSFIVTAALEGLHGLSVDDYLLQLLSIFFV